MTEEQCSWRVQQWHAKLIEGHIVNQPPGLSGGNAEIYNRLEVCTGVRALADPFNLGRRGSHERRAAAQAVCDVHPL